MSPASPHPAANVPPAEIWSTVDGMVTGLLAMLPLLATRTILLWIFRAIVAGLRGGVVLARILL